MSSEALSRSNQGEKPIRLYEVEYMVEDCRKLHANLLNEASFNLDGEVGEPGYMCMTSAGEPTSSYCLPSLSEIDVWIRLGGDRKLMISHMNPGNTEPSVGEWILTCERPALEDGFVSRRYSLMVINPDDFRAMTDNLTSQGVLVKTPSSREDFDCLKGMLFEAALMKGYTAG